MNAYFNELIFFMTNKNKCNALRKYIYCLYINTKMSSLKALIRYTFCKLYIANQ